MSKIIGTTQNLFFAPSDVSDTYQPYSKLNILCDTATNIPQLMLGQTQTVSDEEVWNGNNVTFNYNTSEFSIKADDYENLNVELLSHNNNNVEQTKDNFLIASDANGLEPGCISNTYIHSNSNAIYNYSNSLDYTGVSGVSFIGCKGNTVKIDENRTFYDNSFYNSNYNTFDLTTPATTVYYNKMINNTFIGSDYNYVNGGNGHKNTYINSYSSFYDNWSLAGNQIFIGNVYGYSKHNKCNLICIGQGIIASAQSADKIILGSFNSNDMKDDDILVVGDGFCNQYIIDNADIKMYTRDWLNKDKVTAFFETITGTGNTAGNYYRHNAFTVNKKGYITISDYNSPSSNSACIGYDGISAHVSGTDYTIKYSDLYKYINPTAADVMNRELEQSLIQQIKDKFEFAPSYNQKNINVNIDNLNSVYSNLDNNTLITLTNTGNASITVTSYYRIQDNEITTTTEIQAGYSVQYMYYNPNQNLDTNWTISGFSPVG